MTSIEILKQAINSIEANIPKIYSSTMIYDNNDSATGFGLAVKPKPDVDYANKPCKAFKHLILCTKEYREEGCAAYKLIRLLEATIAAQGIKELFWRVKPEIIVNGDFDLNYGRNVGKARFSYLLEKDTI